MTAGKASALWSTHSAYSLTPTSHHQEEGGQVTLSGLVWPPFLKHDSPLLYFLLSRSLSLPSSWTQTRGVLIGVLTAESSPDGGFWAAQPDSCTTDSTPKLDLT